MALRLRCLHSCVLALVVGLVLIYSTFLSAQLPLRYLDSSGSASPAEPSNGTTTPGNSSSPSAASSSSTLAAAPSPSLDAQSPGSSSRVVVRMTSRVVTSVREASPPPSSSSQPPPTPSPKEAHLPAAGRKDRPLLTKHVYEAGHPIPSEHLCPKSGEDIQVLILVTSAPGHLSARSAIRMTWGHAAMRRDVALGFVVGRTTNATLQRLMEEEYRLWGDLIQGAFLDSYDNLTLKTVSMLQWAAEHCPAARFMLKTDDDMFIHVDNLLAFARKHSSAATASAGNGRIYGRLAQRWKPVRNTKSKYYVSTAQFSASVYPDFCTGPAYLVEGKAFRALYNAALQAHYLKLEDVFATGIVAQSLGIPRVHADAFANKKLPLQACKLQRLISTHMVQFHEQFDIWKKLQDGRTRCK